MKKGYWVARPYAYTCQHHVTPREPAPCGVVDEVVALGHRVVQLPARLPLPFLSLVWVEGTCTPYVRIETPKYRRNTRIINRTIHPPPHTHTLTHLRPLELRPLAALPDLVQVRGEGRHRHGAALGGCLGG